MAIRDSALASRLGQFQQRHISISKNDEIAFEHFVNYYVLSDETRGANTFLTLDCVKKEVHTGGSRDQGIDGIALLVNGEIVSTKEGVKERAGKIPGSTKATIHFVQTTTQDKDDESKIASFLSGVEAFLSYIEDESNEQDFNDSVRARWQAYHSLFRDKDVNFTLDGQPTIQLFYVYPGYWPMPYDAPEWWTLPNNRLGAKITNPLRRINRMFATDDNPIRFEIIDARRIREIYDNVMRRRVVAREVSFSNRKAAPSVEGVKNSFLGLMNCRDYVDQLIRDPETGDLNQSIAIDNVRLFLGDDANEVNQEIAETIRDNDAKKQFMLLNNGITIVAEDAVVPSNEDEPCQIFNYQIVNGWQTTNILFRNYGYLDDQTFVPVRLVITEDSDLTQKIVRATNTQTPVAESQFLALNPRQLQLEDTYSHPPTGFDLRKINYRRQVSTDHLRVDGPTIDIVSQMECYASMFMGQPHRVNTYNYGNLLIGDDNQTQYELVFHPDHPDEFFYVAGYTLCEAESFIHSLYDEQDSSSTPDLSFDESALSFDEMMLYKHHLLFLFRIMQTKGELPPKANSTRNVQSYRDTLLGVLADQSKKEKAFHDAVIVLKEGLKWYDGQNGEARKWAGFTTKLTEITKSNASRRKSRSTYQRARSETEAQTSSAPDTNNATTGNVPQRAPGATPPISSDDNDLTGTIVGFNEKPSPKSRANWYVDVSVSDGEIKTYEIVSRDVGMWKLDVDNAAGKVIRFVETTGSGHGSRGHIPRAQIRSVS